MTSSRCSARRVLVSEEVDLLLEVLREGDTSRERDDGAKSTGEDGEPLGEASAVPQQTSEDNQIKQVHWTHLFVSD